MISILLYGRNDSYGYNLHKRVAISINCMAEVLDGKDDEIIFVDYNTPDEFPSMLEAIQDTLTPKAKSLVKVVRVRPLDHFPFANKTHLKALEPHARNAGLRRSNPNNRWILSTNTDMIFVPRSEQTLSQAVANLPDGHYGMPRFELPETLWESLDRMNPAETIEMVSRWGWEYHLNEVALSDPPIMFDAPGDFQLMLRQDLFDIDGFDENMLLGWHVDSNIAKRLSILHGNVQDLSGKFFGYHCDHTRQVTPAHQKSAPANDLAFFVYGLTNQFVENQRSTWGFSSSELEVFSLTNSIYRRYEDCLQALELRPQVGLTFSRYADEGTSKSGISPQHRAPFIADLFSSLPRQTSLYWVGALDQNFELFREISIQLKFHKDFQVLNVEDAMGREVSELLDGLVEPDQSVFICNFTGIDGHQSLVAQAMSYLLGLKCDHLPNCPSPSRFVGIGASNGLFESFWESKMVSAKTPFSLGFKHGLAELPAAISATVKNNHEKFDLLTGSIPGVAGMRNQAGAIESIPGVPGPVSFGPYDWPAFGEYLIEVTLANCSRSVSSLNWESVKTISKKLRSRGNLMGHLLPFGAAFAKLMWCLRLGPFGTVYIEVCYGSGKSFRAFPGKYRDRTLRLVRKIKFSSSSRDSHDFLGLDVMVRTTGHYFFEIQSITLSRIRK
jgi:hypothetical protein